MLRRLCAGLPYPSTSNLRPSTAAVVIAASHRRFLPPFHKPYSRSCIYSNKPSPVTVSFLTSSLGIPAGAARSIALSQRIQLKSVANARSVASLLKGYGFNEAQIVGLLTRTPSVFDMDPVNTLKPKLEFYRGIGLVGDAVAKVLAASPYSLMNSLESRLLPNLELLKSILGSDERVVAAVKHSPALIAQSFGRTILPRIELLRADGVAEDVMLLLLTKYGRTFTQGLSRFKEGVDMVRRLGVSPSQLTFAHALGMFSKLSQKVWKVKVDSFRCLGWSEDQFMAAFARQPFIMMPSTEKVRRNIEFVEEKLGWDSEYISRYPVVLSLSLEKRLMPRHAVLHVLASKGLVKAPFSAAQFKITEKNFLAKFVIPYQQKAPEVVDAYGGSRERVEDEKLLSLF